MISSLLKAVVVSLSLVAYGGAIGIVWTSFQHLCATAFIHNIVLFTSVAVFLSTAAAVTQFARLRWLTLEEASDRRLLFFSGAPAVAVILFWIVSLATVASSKPNQPVHPTAASGRR